MFRIAVIQNEVEMQHSGYVDSVPQYREKFDFNAEVIFNRFSSVNIIDLFREGENYLLEYDCLILGTNATSDGDVYNFLQNDNNRNILNNFISQGKGLLICSQKKFVLDSSHEGNNARKTAFLPQTYEYNVVCRPDDESSSDKGVKVIENAYNNIQNYILSVPHSITNHLIEERCEKNDFQTHYYRDYIVPKNEASYYPLLLDTKECVRNTLMVAVPQTCERIVISTMALDWAGHYEVLENVIQYLLSGLPEVAFLNKNNHDVEEFKFLISETDLSKISYKLYDGISNYFNSNTYKYHSLLVLSPAYSEEEVSDFWEQIQNSTNYIRLFHYRYINNDPKKDLTLVHFSHYSYIEDQKRNVETWLKSKYSFKLWDNSFWKTYDVILAFQCLGVDLKSYLFGIFRDISKHYNNGSYDGVLAPTCGLLEVLAIVCNDSSYLEEIETAENMLKDTITWLAEKYEHTSNYNKKFIIRAFYKSGQFENFLSSLKNREEFIDTFREIALNDQSSLKDKFEMDLCLEVETCLIYSEVSHKDEHNINKKIKACMEIIRDSQQQNGRWDNNLGKTARILIFLIENKEKLQSIKGVDIDKTIEIGILALKKSYTLDNWENSIVTTANAIHALVSYDNNAQYKSKDFLNQVGHDAKLGSAYNALGLSLKTLSNVMDQYNLSQSELHELRNAKKKYRQIKRINYFLSNAAIISVLLIISYYIFLILKNNELFVEMLTQSLMWIPIVIGLAISSLVNLLPKGIKKLVNFVKKR